MDNSKKKALRFSLVGFILLLVSMLITGFMGISDKLNGFRLAIDNYLNLWFFHHAVAYVAIVLIFVAITSFIVLSIFALKNKKAYLLLPILGLTLAIGFFAFILVLVIPNLETGVLGGRMAILVMSGVTGLVLFSLYCFFAGIDIYLRRFKLHFVGIGINII